MLRVEHLTKRYGNRVAVDGVRFSVESGEIVGFLGPNGAGKSTTLRMITGFLTPTGGTVHVDGIDAVANPLQAVTRIGYMPEGVPLYGEMRVAEYLGHRAELKGVARRDIPGRIDAALGQAGVAEVRARIIGQLSKGYKQRVGLADALVADPPLLILDEPTSGLDPNQMRQVRDLIRGFAGKKTVFVSTHILPEVEATCSRVVIINRGRVVGEGPTSELRRSSSEQRVEVVLRGELALATKSLGAVAGVRGVTPVSVAGDVHTLMVDAAGGDEVLEALVRATVAQGLALREIKRATVSLEDIFAELTTTDPAKDGAAVTSGAEARP